MTLHPRKSSTKKATVQSSITNYFTPNSNSRTAKAPPRASAPGRGASSKSAEKSKPLKERENDTSSNGTTPEREGFDDTETVDLVSDDEADVFRDTRPTKRTRRVISDDHEEDLFAPAGVPSSYTEVYDGPAPSTPFRTPFTLGSPYSDPFPQLTSTNFFDLKENHSVTRTSFSHLPVPGLWGAHRSHLPVPTPTQTSQLLLHSEGH